MRTRCVLTLTILISCIASEGLALATIRTRGATCASVFISILPEAEATNRNGAVPVEIYEQSNDRTFGIYKGSLGAPFAKHFPTKSWLDSGAGFATAALDAVESNRAETVVAINAQDALSSLRQSEHRWFETHLDVDRTARIVSFAGLDAIGPAMLDPELGLWQPNAIETMVRAASEKLIQLETSGRFQYVVGFTEVVLRKLTRKFDLISDLFGSYFYSAERTKLLQMYYSRLSENGEAFVVFSAHDLHWRYNESTKAQESMGSEYGPENFVRRRDGRLQKFEEYLVEVYPTVFSIYKANADQARPRTKHQVLVIKRDANIQRLRLLKELVVVRERFGNDGIHSQIPSVTYREPSNAKVNSER